MTIQHNPSAVQSKEHFYVNRNARKLFHLTDPAFLALPSTGQESFKQAEKQTGIINDFLIKQKGAEAKPVLPAQFNGMKLLHELFHYVMTSSIAARQPTLLENAYTTFETEISKEQSTEYLTRFISAFPTEKVYAGSETPLSWLNIQNNKKYLLEESFLVWLNSQNPALDQFSDLLTDQNVMKEEAYRKLILTMQSSMKAMGPVGAGNIDLIELLTEPIRHAPSSILDQLRYIQLKWSDLLADSPLLKLLPSAIDLIEDEDKYLFFEKIAHSEEAGKASHFFEKEAHIPSYSASDSDAPANYSTDSSWMPEVVMLAKSTYVWLDQLTKLYRRPINRLQDIPDEELDLMADRGFTALWLIGIWQRSYASQKIKQLQGNPEAKHQRMLSKNMIFLMISAAMRVMRTSGIEPGLEESVWQAIWFRTIPEWILNWYETVLTGFFPPVHLHTIITPITARI